MPIVNSQNNKLRNYFLGRLSDAEAARFEEEIAEEAVIFEEARNVELEMIDDYARGYLSTSDSEAFEAVYLATDERREKLSFARSLMRVANEKTVKGVSGVDAAPGRFWGPLTGWRVVFAGMATVMLLVVGLIYVAVRSGVEISVGTSRNSNEPLIGYKETRDPDSNTVAAVNIDQNSGSRTIIEVPKNSPQKVPPASAVPASSPATFTLLAGALRGEGDQSINIPRNAREVVLRIVPPTDAPKYQSYSASVKTADGESVLAISNLRAFRFRIPASKLESRTYIIFLEGKNARGRTESVAEYTIRVRAQKNNQEANIP